MQQQFVIDQREHEPPWIESKPALFCFQKEDCDSVTPTRNQPPAFYIRQVTEPSRRNTGRWYPKHNDKQTKKL